ncbi:helix-turn-helix domain-containing protein [Thalassospira profundimaris]|uniref:helix-turn-helix domain-containing protein n=1 Tax=Thalassospira profundimaris TaxID=502049 RepID=UPI0015F0B09E|nr:helix-turn-helix domain-containing protein [Thalassospira profundimaris]
MSGAGYGGKTGHNSTHKITLHRDGAMDKIRARMDRFEPALSSRKWGLDGAGQHACCHAVLLENGMAQISLRHGAIRLAGPALIWLPAGEGRVCEIEAGARGYVMSMPDDVVAKSLGGHFLPDHAGQGTGHHRGLRFVADTVHGLHLADHQQDFEQARLICGVMAAEIRANRHMGETVLAAQLIALLAILARLAEGWMTRGQHDGARPDGGSVTLHRFLQVLEIHFRDHWNVGDYARALGTSERRLALATVRATGKPPLQLIHDRVLHEACLRLEQSPQAVAQVAYGLGFRDPAYFNRFFKRYLGLAPGAWRRQKRAGQIRDDTSFAAWP